MTKYLEDMSREEKLEIIRRPGRSREQLLSILLDLQKLSASSSVDEETALLVADEMDLSEAKIFEILTFYAMLADKPQGKYVLEICKSTPCHYSGSDKIAEIVREELGIGVGETTADGMFSVKYVPCVGACDIGPVIRTCEHTIGNLTREKIHALIEQLRNGGEVTAC